MTRDPSLPLIARWLTARSLVRGLPAPVADHGGYRVDTGSAEEARRWVFAEALPGIVELAATIEAPRHPIKLCGPPEVLLGCLPPHWRLLSCSHFMSRESAAASTPRPLPAGYRLSCAREGPGFHVEVRAPDGTIAASGHAGSAAGVFVYDRIAVAPPHRRLGLGGNVMTALGLCRRDRALAEVLVATDEGRALYETLGWSVRSPYSTAVIPET